MADVRKELNFCKKTGLNVLGVVENMADIRIAFTSLSDPSSGIFLVDSNGNDVTISAIERIQILFPELLDCSIHSNLFKLPENNIDNTSQNKLNNPKAMSDFFNVPYLGKLPMDPNMMKACEEGKSFLEAYPNSPASQPFADIVKKIVDMTDSLNKSI